jgi:hypothetical protein
MRNKDLSCTNSALSVFTSVAHTCGYNGVVRSSKYVMRSLLGLSHARGHPGAHHETLGENAHGTTETRKEGHSPRVALQERLGRKPSRHLHRPPPPSFPPPSPANVVGQSPFGGWWRRAAGPALLRSELISSLGGACVAGSGRRRAPTTLWLTRRP